MHLCGLSCYNAAPAKSAPQLAAAATGKHLTTLAFSEQGSRSHFWAPVSQEVRENGHLQVSARKSWVTSAGHADGYIVSTRTANAQSQVESTLYLVLRDDPGLAVSGPWEALGLRGNASAPMTLQGVRLTPERALSEPGKGMEVMLGVVLPWFQLGSAAISVGLSEAAIEATRGHLTTQRFEHLRLRGGG
jgi:alkylation response protein AidB-like acyl-CoA dehydrogenase